MSGESWPYSGSVDGPEGDSRPEVRWLRRSSPVRFFHGVLFILGGGLALFWSRWGILLIVVWAVIGLARLKAKASTLDMAQERLKLDHLREELTFLYDSATHPDGSAEEQLRMLETLHRLGGINAADYEARRAQISQSGMETRTDQPDAGS